VLIRKLKVKLTRDPILKNAFHFVCLVFLLRHLRQASVVVATDCIVGGVGVVRFWNRRVLTRYEVGWSNDYPGHAGCLFLACRLPDAGAER
jgi:hypothetical protein